MDETAVSPQMANWSATNYGKTLKQPFGERNGRFAQTADSSQQIDFAVRWQERSHLSQGGL
jgi:hypothetical protein